MPNKPPHESQTTTEDKANMQETIWVHAVPLKPPQRSLTVCTGFSVFCMAKKKPCGKADLAISCYHCVYECIILLKPPRSPSLSVLAFQCFAWPRKSCVEKQTWSPVVILSLRQLCQYRWFSQIWSHVKKSITPLCPNYSGIII